MQAAAHIAVQHAIRAGILPRPPACEYCGLVNDGEARAKGQHRFVWHHWSYAEEHHLDVIPLCRACHACVHVGLYPEPRTGRRYTQTRTPRGRGGPAIVSGDMLLASMAAAGVKQRQLARRLGVIPSRLHNWIAGRTPPPPEMLPALCRELGMDVAAARRFYAACGVNLDPVLGESSDGGEPAAVGA